MFEVCPQSLLGGLTSDLLTSRPWGVWVDQVVQTAGLGQRQPGGTSACPTCPVLCGQGNGRGRSFHRHTSGPDRGRGPPGLCLLTTGPRSSGRVAMSKSPSARRAENDMEQELDVLAFRPSSPAVEPLLNFSIF